MRILILGKNEPILNFLAVVYGKQLREAFQTKKRGNLENSLNRGGGVVKKSKKSQDSVGKSSKFINKVPSSRGYQRLKYNDSFSSYEDPKT